MIYSNEIDKVLKYFTCEIFVTLKMLEQKGYLEINRDFDSSLQIFYEKCPESSVRIKVMALKKEVPLDIDRELYLMLRWLENNKFVVISDPLNILLHAFHLTYRAHDEKTIKDQMDGDSLA